MARVFLFDLDETLVDCEAQHEIATRAMLEHTGVPAEVARAIFADVTGRRTRDIVDAFRVATSVPHELDHLLEVRHAAFREALRARPPSLLPGAREALDEAGRLGRVALVTSGYREDVHATLEALGLLGRFDVVVTGEDVRLPKPAPEPYLLAAGRLGVPPRHAVAFEDSAHGVASALAAGCRVVAVPHAPTTPREAVAGAHLVLASMREALPLDALLRRM